MSFDIYGNHLRPGYCEVLLTMTERRRLAREWGEADAKIASRRSW